MKAGDNDLPFFATAGWEYLPSWCVQAVLPSQLADMRRPAHLSGEKYLLLRILALAIDDFHNGRFSRGARKHRLYLEAREWLWDDSDYPCSMRWTCTALGIEDVEGLRRRLDEGEV